MEEEKPKKMGNKNIELKSNHKIQPKVLAGFGGFIAGVVLIGSFLYLSYSLSINSSQYANQQNTPQFSLLNTVDMSQFPTATQTLVSTPEALLDENVGFRQRLFDVYEEIQLALEYMEDHKYVEAILIWDHVISVVPEYTDAYYQRGICYMVLTNNQRVLSEYLTYLNRSLEDIDKAIEMGPTKGDYYFDRSYLLLSLTDGEESIADTVSLRTRAIDDLAEAVMLGSSVDDANYYPFQELQILGRCSEALDGFLEIEPFVDLSERKSAVFLRLTGITYNCLEEYDKALEYLEEAASVQEKWFEYPTEELYWEAVAYHALGQHHAALEILDELIERNPRYNGLRYYLRALIYYELGNSEQANEDLYTGTGNVWTNNHIRAYVMGKLALDEGNEAAALSWFQLAEATIPKSDYPYIYNLAINEISILDDSLLYPQATESPDAVYTPIPAIGDQIYYTPTPSSKFFNAATEMANYPGTGILYIEANQSKFIMFRPRGYQTFEEILSLTINVDGVDVMGNFFVEYYLQKLDGSGYNPAEYIRIGENKISNPEQYVNDRGYFIIELKNIGADMQVFENISVQMEVVDQDGQKVVVGIGN